MLKHHTSDIHPGQQHPSSNLTTMMQSPQSHNPPMAMLAANQPGPSSQQRFQVIPQQQPRMMRQPPAMLSSNSLAAGMNPASMHALSPGSQSTMGFPTGVQAQQQQANAVRRVASQPSLHAGMSPLGIGAGGQHIGAGQQVGMPQHLRQLPQGHQQLRMQQQQSGHAPPSDVSTAPGNRQGSANLLVGGAGRLMHSQPPLMNSLGIPPGHAAMVPSQQNNFHTQSMSGQNSAHQSSVSPRPMSQPAHIPNGMAPPNTLNHARLTPDMFMNSSNHHLAGNPHRGNPLPGQYIPNPATSPEAMDVTSSIGATVPLGAGGSRATSEFSETTLPIHERYDTGFNGGAPAIPPRPPSISNPNPSMTPIQHHSPHPMSSSPSNIPGSISRPLSQPQAMHSISAASSRTPRPPAQTGIHTMTRMMSNGASSLQPGAPSTSLPGRQPGSGSGAAASSSMQQSGMSRVPINQPST